MDNTDIPLNHSTVREDTEARTYESIHPERRHINHDQEDTIQDVGDYEKESPRSDFPRKSYDKGYSNVEGGVNIERAEAEFAELSKELSRTSQLSRRITRTQSRQKGDAIPDVEKAPESEGSDDEPFDLEVVLRGNKSEEEAAGIKSKHIGVVWDNLTVSGIGGVKNYVKVSCSQLGNLGRELTRI